MGKEEIPFNDFMNAVALEYQDFVKSIHEYLLENGCKSTIELKKTGYFVSYTFNKTKKSIVNFVFRKKGLIIRIYGENAYKYLEFLDTLPNEMVSSIKKAPVCKRLINPNDCNSKCSMGYDFVIKDTHFQKCRYNCFMFDINNENNDYIKTFVEHELREISAL